MPTLSVRRPFAFLGLSGAILCSSVLSTAHADVKLPAIFSDNLILQRNQPLPIWGTADPGEKVTVTLADSKAETTAGADGKWLVKLPARAAGENLELNVQGKNAVTFKNVVMGDVWICSGQSNMAFLVAGARNVKADIDAANYPNIRLFTVGRLPIDVPQTDTKGSWVPTTPRDAAAFSAVGYFFGREIHQKTGVPIGLIHTSWGGTPAEAWTSKDKLRTLPELKPLLDNWDARVANAPAAKEKYEKETLPAWEAAVAQAKAEGKPEPRKPNPPQDAESPSRPANLFNGMINPLIPFAIKGAIWYQGESNAGAATVYRTLFPAMITDWRTRWGQGDFPFFWVQLANYQKVQTVPVEEGQSGWPMLREAQAMTLSLPHTGMATAIDLADADNPGDIHPKNKQDVGKRLAGIALSTEYGIPTPGAGPSYTGMMVEGGKIRLKFNNTNGGLKANGDTLKGFAIADDTGPWQWADAVVDGNSVVVSSAAVAAPTRVRYDWAINPIGNLVNGDGLPAYPFRTDTGSKQ